MSEQTPESSSTPTPSAPAPGSEQTPPVTQTFSQEQVNALLAEQKRKVQEKFADYDDVKAKAEKFVEVEEASKSEQQRAADAAAQARKDAEEARAETLRYKAAAEHKVGADYFDLLGTGDEAAITSRAERLGGLLTEHATFKAENEQLRAEVEALRTGKPAPITTRPVQQLQPGATPGGQLSEDDALYAQLFGG